MEVSSTPIVETFSDEFLFLGKFLLGEGFSAVDELLCCFPLFFKLLRRVFRTNWLPKCSRDVICVLETVRISVEAKIIGYDVP